MVTMCRNARRGGVGLTVVALVAAAVPASGAAEEVGRLGTNEIVFSSFRFDTALGEANDDIYVTDVDGSNERRLTTAAGQDGSAMVSPDRRTIVFASERTGQMQLWAMDVDGSDQRRLLASSSFDFHPAWSHDGSRILFQRLSPTTGFDLWILDLATGVQSRLTSLPRNEVGAFFSPDDSTVVFGGNNGGQDVWVVPAAGGVPVALTSGACITGTDPCVPAFDGQPSWTPDGRILFMSDRTGGIGIWTMAADGTDPRLVIDLGDASAGMPYMSANGQRIAFTSNVHDLEGDRNVHTVRSDGRQLRRLASAGDDLAPTFASGA